MSSESKYVEKITTSADLWARITRATVLSHLDIEVTERCNNDCLHCYINLPLDDGQAQQAELSFDEIRSIADGAANLGCLSVRLTGGEPLVRDDFPEIYRYLIHKGMRVTVFTNATLLTPAIIDLFRKYPPFDLEISVYGMSQKSYEAVTRNPGSFAAAMAGIERLRERQLPFVLKSVALPPNLHELRDFRDWAIRLTGREPGLVMKLDLRATRDDERRNRVIKAMRLTPEQLEEFLRWDEAKYRSGMEQFVRKFLRSAPGDDKLFHCGSGMKVLTVNAYGQLQPCMLLRHPDCIYNLRNGSLRDALEHFIPRLREMRAQNTEYLTRCARCFLQALCGQCPAKSWMEYGELDRPVEYLCTLAHAEAVFLGLLEEGEKAWERNAPTRS